MDDRDPFSHLVIGAAIEVHREMGPGLLESIYQQCMAIELGLKGIEFQPQARLPVVYKGIEIDADDLKMDFYFPTRLVLELKAVERLLPVREAQLLSYLRLSKTRIGLLINFNVPVLKDGIKRMAL